jgi:hypothetical protein
MDVKANTTYRISLTTTVQSVAMKFPEWFYSKYNCVLTAASPETFRYTLE